MPCDSITTQTISAALSKALPSVLADALQADGWTITEKTAACIYARNGIDRMTWTAGVGFTISSSAEARGREVVASIVRAYSRQAVTWAAQRAGWTVQRTGDNTLTVNRR